MEVNNKILDIIKQIDERLNKSEHKDQIDPFEEMQSNKYNGVGQKVAEQMTYNPMFRRQFNDMLYDMNPELQMWDEYGQEYFEVQNVKMIFGTDEFKNKIRNTKFAKQRLYDVNKDKNRYGRYEKFGNIDIDELSKINRTDLYEWWGRMMTRDTDEKLIEGQEYTFTFVIPISDDIPSYEEFSKTHILLTAEQKMQKKIEEEEKRFVEIPADKRMNAKEFLEMIERNKKQQAGKKGGNRGRKIIINANVKDKYKIHIGKIFDNITGASNDIGISRKQLNTWLKNGWASYVKEDEQGNIVGYA